MTKIGDQIALFHDLMRYPGSDPLMHFISDRPLLVLDVGSGLGALIHWLRNEQQVSPIAGIPAAKPWDVCRS